MSLSRALIILRLLISGEARLIRMALYAIPVIFCIVFYSFQIGSKVLVTFEDYMEESYIGVMGELTVNSPSADFLLNLYQDSRDNSLNVSQKFSTKALLGVRSQKIDVIKGMDIYVYQPEYLKQKFEGYQEHADTIVVSSVMANQLGLFAGKQKLTYYDPDSERNVTFNHVLLVDLGFLTSEPITIMGSDVYRKLFGRLSKLNQLEFHLLPVLGIKKVEQLAKQRFESGAYSSYKVVDTHNLTSEHREIFTALQWLSYVLFSVLVLLNLLLSILSVQTVLKSKKNSIHTMKLLGMTEAELWVYVFSVWITLLAFSYLVSQCLIRITESSVVQYIFNM